MDIHLNGSTAADSAHEDGSNATRRLILHDSLSFLGLVAVTIVLFAITLFLFRSFTARRADLAAQSSAEGTREMQSGRPEAAISALRTALSYAPDTRAYELLLAQALGEAGHTEESYNYFMGLWGAEPGNGFINLQLARLAAKRGSVAASGTERQAAVNFYRAAIYGTWEGDGVERRPQVRLELARYLLAIHEKNQARVELLTAGGNANETPELDLTIGGLLEQADDTADAWTYYTKALTARPEERPALEAASRLAYRAGDFAAAHRLFAREKVQHNKEGVAIGLSPEDSTMNDIAARILELEPSSNLPSRERIRRILSARALAKRRLDACTLNTSVPAPEMQALAARWATPAGTANAATLAGDSSLQDAAMQLVYYTEVQASQNKEVQASKTCGPATGDDALLLLMAGTSTSAPLPGNSLALR